MRTERPCTRLASLVVLKQGRPKARNSLSPPVGGPDKSNNLTGKQGVMFGQSCLPEKGPQPRASALLASHRQQLQTVEITAVPSSSLPPSSVLKQPVKPRLCLLKPEQEFFRLPDSKCKLGMVQKLAAALATQRSGYASSSQPLL